MDKFISQNLELLPMLQDGLTWMWLDRPKIYNSVTKARKRPIDLILNLLVIGQAWQKVEVSDIFDISVSNSQYILLRSSSFVIDTGAAKYSGKDKKDKSRNIGNLRGGNKTYVQMTANN